MYAFGDELDKNGWNGYGGYPQKDDVKAYMWFAIAAESGDGLAAMFRDTTGERMTRYQIGEAQRDALEWIGRPPPGLPRWNWVDCLGMFSSPPIITDHFTVLSRFYTAKLNAY